MFLGEVEKRCGSGKINKLGEVSECGGRVSVYPQPNPPVRHEPKLGCNAMHSQLGLFVSELVITVTEMIIECSGVGGLRVAG